MTSCSVAPRTSAALSSTTATAANGARGRIFLEPWSWSSLVLDWTDVPEQTYPLAGALTLPEPWLNVLAWLNVLTVPNAPEPWLNVWASAPALPEHRLNVLVGTQALPEHCLNVLVSAQTLPEHCLGALVGIQTPPEHWYCALAAATVALAPC